MSYELAAVIYGVTVAVVWGIAKIIDRKRR